MFRLVICCGGGMSSSVLSVKFNDEIKERGWEEKISIDYLPLPFLFHQMDKYDFALLCPHLRYHALRAVEAGKVTIPFYIIPSRLYGSMRLLPLVEDAIDALFIYKETKANTVCFPGEDLLVTKRDTSYRRWIKTHPITK